MPHKIWKPLLEVGEDEIRSLAEKLKVSSFHALLMYSAGIRTRQDADQFFNPSVQALHDPYLMKDMDKAVERINLARSGKERVRVYGDYDVDGTTSVAVAYSFLKDYFEHIDYYIPDRDKEGYGISSVGIDDALQKGVTLMIALDCGIRSVDLIERARKAGLDIIVCDHHLPGAELPIASAILNPKQPGCPYPFKELSGCAIGWKLVQALCRNWGLPDSEYLKFTDMVAVSIASDLVSMTGENRIITALGLRKLERDPSPGLSMIIDKFIRREEELHIDVTKVVFMIGPRINAAGRLSDAKVAVRLLLSEGREEAAGLASELNRFNQERKLLDRVITEEALQQAQEEDRFTTVVCGSDWHKGVVGIVASRLIESHYRPTIVLTESDEVLVGSARSIPGFNIHDALVECSTHLIQFGGHAFAAGMKMHKDEFDGFKEKFEAVAARLLTREQLIPTLSYHAEIPLSGITPVLVKTINRFAPFGPDHQQPLFLTSGVYDSGQVRTLGNGHEHLRLNLITSPTDRAIPAIGFGLGSYYEPISKGRRFHVLYHVEMSEYNGTESLQLMIKDIKLA